MLIIHQKQVQVNRREGGESRGPEIWDVDLEGCPPVLSLGFKCDFIIY